MFAEVVRWNVGQMKWGQMTNSHKKNRHEVLKPVPLPLRSCKGGRTPRLEGGDLWR